MSQSHVERVIGLLATDEALRRQFEADPRATLQLLKESGVELNWCEHQALSSLDPDQLTRFAAAIDARLQKADLRDGAR